MPDPFELPEGTTSHFPSHGWIEGATGLRHLRFPILRVFQPWHPAHSRYQAHGLAGVWLQTRSPFRTLRQLGIALRDLHAELGALLPIVEDQWFDKEVSDARNLALNRQGEGLQRCEVLLVSVFVLLRRLADDLMESLKPVLFEHWRSAPGQLMKAIALARSGKLHSLNPYCDADALAHVLLNDATWLHRLRKENGIRDTLVHWPHLLNVSPHGSKPVDSERFAWHISASLTISTREGMRSKDIFPVLLECLAGACAFMTSITRLVGGMDDYARGDIMFLSGEDNNIVGFWPTMGGGQHEFPLRK